MPQIKWNSHLRITWSPEIDQNYIQLKTIEKEQSLNIIFEERSVFSKLMPQKSIIFNTPVTGNRMCIYLDR